MISWIQRTFQHHFRIIFAVLLAITIISFIVTIGATPGIGRAGQRVVTRDFFGNNLASQGDMQRLINDAGLSSELQLGANGADDDQIRSYALQRAAALHMADELGIPAATPAEIKDSIESLRIFSDKDGKFDAARYASFREAVRSNPQTGEGDVARVIADDVRVRKVQKLLEGPGYVLPADIKNELVRADTAWTLAMAMVDYASFNPAITPTDAELAKFYEDNGFRYQVPTRVEASYLDFPAAAYLGEVKLTDADVRAYYDANPGRFPKPAASPAAKSDANADFAAVRPQVEATLKLERAQRLAAKAASDVAFALYESKVESGPALDAFLASRKLAPKPLAPFTQESGPVELGGSPEIGSAAFKLDAQRFYSEALPTPSGAAILIWKNSLPARQPLLAEVKSKVLADFIENEKRKRFVDLGQRLRTRMEAGLKAGEPLEKVAAAAAGAESVKIETKTLPAFTLRTRPKDLNPAVTGTLERLEKGKVSDMVVDADKGYLVYAVEKKLPDLAESGPQFAQMRASIASTMSRLAPGAYLSELVAQELRRTEPAKK